MRALALLLLLAIVSKVIAISLTQLWMFKTSDEIRALAFSNDGLLGVASWDSCAYILDVDGNLISKYCGGDSMDDVSYCCNRFGFVNWDGFAYFYDLSRGIWKKVRVGNSYDAAITLFQNGFLGGFSELAYFNSNGEKRWHINVEYTTNGPVIYNGFVYIPRYDISGCCSGIGALTILKLIDGSEVRTVKFNENVWDVQVCEHYLALGTAHHVYLYDISNPMSPKIIWHSRYLASTCSGGSCGGVYSVAFSPDCKYLVGADVNDLEIHVFEVVSGKEVLRKEVESGVRVVAWWKNRVAVGLNNGKVYVFKVKGYFPSSTLVDAYELGHKGYVATILKEVSQLSEIQLNHLLSKLQRTLPPSELTLLMRILQYLTR